MFKDFNGFHFLSILAITTSVYWSIEKVMDIKLEIATTQSTQSKDVQCLN